MNSLSSRAEFYRSLIHPLMSIGVSVSGALALGWLISTLVGQGAPRVETVIAVVLAGIVEAVAGNLLYQERAGIGNRVRELLIYLLVVYAVLSLLGSGPLAERFAPGWGQIPALILVGLCWTIAFVFHNRLRGREALLRTFAGRHGPQLRSAVIDCQHDMALTVGELRRARSLIGGFFVLLCIVTLLGTFEFMPTEQLVPASGAFVTLVLYGIVSVWVIGALNIFIEEYAANGEGLAVPLRLGRRRGVLVALIILLVFVTAFVVSSEEGILPLEAIGDFFRWLGNLLRREREPLESPLEQVPESPPPLPPDVMEQLSGMEPVLPPLWIRLLASLIRRVVVYTAVVLGAVLLFGPLFSASFRKGLRELNLRHSLKRLVSVLRTRWRILKHLLQCSLRRSQRPSLAEREEPAPASGSRSWKPSIRKRRQMSRVVSVFVSITRWGKTHGVPYGRTLAATEYLRAVATLYPEHYADTQTLARIFGEARFSRHLVSISRMREYVGAAKRITRSA